MTQAILNNNDNINIPHNVSLWFDEDWAADYLEFGDILVDGVNVAPDFLDFRSYRNGLNAIRKRLLTAKNADVQVTLREPNILNYRRVLFGGAVATGQSVVALEAQLLQAEQSADGEFFDLSGIESDFDAIAVTGIYAQSDVLRATNLISANLTVDTDGKTYYDQTDTGALTDSSYYITYEVTVSAMYSSEIFGATNTTIEGAAKLQARNLQGGVVQIWDLSSVHLAANGSIGYALDDVQTIPVIMTLQERSGTFGTIYTK